MRLDRKGKASASATEQARSDGKKTDAPTTDATAKPTTEAPRELDADTPGRSAACPSRARGTEVHRPSHRPELKSAGVASSTAVRSVFRGTPSAESQSRKRSTESVIGVRPPRPRLRPGRPVFVSFLQAVHYCNTVSLREKTDPRYSAAR